MSGRIIFAIMCAAIAGIGSVEHALAQGTSVQTYTVRGQIFSMIDGLPLANIQVNLKGTDLSGVTDATGTFSIRGVPPGTYDIVAKYPDFDAVVLKNVSVPPRTGQSFVFNLEPQNGPTPLPFVDSRVPDSLGFVQGEVNVRIQAYDSRFESGRLVLRAVPAGDANIAYVYPAGWKLLPVQEQRFRFKFYLPEGKQYRLQLVWQEEQEAYLAERVVDEVRQPAQFDLRQRKSISDVLIDFDSSRITKPGKR